MYKELCVGWCVAVCEILCGMCGTVCGLSLNWYWLEVNDIFVVNILNRLDCPKWGWLPPCGEGVKYS